MNKSHAKYRLSLALLSLACFLNLVLWAEIGLSFDSSGMSLSVFSKKSSFNMGETLNLTIVLKNISGGEVITDSGLSSVELYRYLSITDPAGVTHSFGAGSEVHDMPQPIFWKDKAWKKVEILGADFVLSQVIDDLVVLLPMISTTPGWYTIRCSLPFVRYVPVETAVSEHYGTLGLVEGGTNWTGTIDSTEIQILVSPGEGGSFEVQTVDKALSHLPLVPVRIYRSSDIQDKELNAAWSDAAALMTGTTDFSDGIARNWAGPACSLKGNYTAIAFYQGEYRKAEWDSGSTSWGVDCSGLLSAQIVFGETAPVFPPLSSFSAFAFNSIWIKAGAVVNSGNIGVGDASQGLWLDSGVEVSLGLNARAADGVTIYGDSVKIWSRASVDSLHYNTLVNSGTIRGEAVTPLSLPLPVHPPAFPAITPGIKNISVGYKKVTTLDPGSYRDVSLGISATLKLKEGIYNFRNVNMGASSKLLCLGPGLTEIRIKDRLYPGVMAQIGPSSSTESARKVMVYVAGTNGNLLNLLSYPRAAEIGLSNTIKANIYAPNGTLTFGAGSNIQGAFIGKAIEFGIGAKVSLDSGF